MVTIETPPDAAPLNCSRHAQIPASHTCSTCGTPACDSCAHAMPDGTIQCPGCSPPPKPGTMRPVFRPPGAPHPAATNWIEAGKMCEFHPGVQATQKCSECRAFMCATCDFPLGQGNHLCPSCAMVSNTGLSSGRLKNVIIGFVLASIATLGFGAVMFGFFANADGTAPDEQTFGFIFLGIVLAPSLIGFGVSSSAQENHLANPISVWIAIIWNALIVLGFIFLVIIGNLMK